MRKLSLFLVLLLVALVAGVFTVGALPPRDLPAAAQAEAAAQETATSAPAAATQADATPLPEPPTATSTGSTLAGTSWIMSSLNGALPVADAAVTLALGVDGSASGSDGCNRYWTTYEQDGQNLTFKQPMAGTLMACEKPVMAQATEYREALATVTSFMMSARQLVLFAGDDIVLTYIADAATLEGTSWDVVNYNNGREAVVGVLEGTEITLNFDETDLNGNAGCNNYFAGYAVKGKRLLVDPPGATMMFCETPEGVMAQEAEYLAALESAATFRIEGDQLWLRTAEDAIAVIAIKKEIVDLPAPEPKTPTGTVSGANVLNIRSGPGTNFPVIGAARNGDSGTIVGRSEDSRWWVVDAPSLPGGVGWVSSDFVSATDADDVPVVPSPPLPPPTPTRVPPPTAAPPTATPIRPTAVPPPQAQINFWADRTQISRGECATLNWNVQNVRGVWVYPQGSDFNAFPRTGQGNERVCPAATTTYEMRVLLQDGSTQFRQVTINVAQPIAPPQPPPVTQPIAPPQPPPAGDPLTGTRWNVVNFNNGMGAVTGTIPDTTITLAFDAGRASGNAGCNSYSANYRASGNTLTVDRPGSTSMFCDAPEGVMQQEQQYLAALHSAATFQISGNQLQIRSGSDALAVVAERAP
jgi:heat shock protein HslJ